MGIDDADEAFFSHGVIQSIFGAACRHPVLNGDDVHGMVDQKAVAGKQAAVGIFIA